MLDLRTFSAGSSALGGVIWLAAPLRSPLYHLSLTVRYDLLLVVAPLLVAVGLVGFGDAYGEAYGSLGRAGIASLVVGVLVLALAPLTRYLVVTLPVGVMLLAGATAGAVIAEAGAVAVAVEIWRTEVPSRRLAVWLPLALPATALVNYLGFVFNLYRIGFDFYAGVSGLAWLAVGYYTLQARRDDTDAPS